MTGAEKAYDVIKRLSGVINDVMPDWQALPLDVKTALTDSLDPGTTRTHQERLAMFSESLRQTGWSSGFYNQQAKTIAFASIQTGSHGLFMIWLAACIHALE